MKSENDFASRDAYKQYLVDYYAGQALNGLLANANYHADAPINARQMAIDLVVKLYTDR